MEELMFELFDKDRFQERLNRVLFIGNKDFEEEARKLSEDSGIEFSGEEVENTYKDFSEYGSVFLGKPQIKIRRKTLATNSNTRVVYPLMVDVSNLFCSKSHQIGRVVVEEGESHLISTDEFNGVYSKVRLVFDEEFKFPDGSVVNPCYVEHVQASGDGYTKETLSRKDREFETPIPFLRNLNGFQRRVDLTDKIPDEVFN